MNDTQHRMPVVAEFVGGPIDGRIDQLWIPVDHGGYFAIQLVTHERGHRYECNDPPQGHRYECSEPARVAQQRMRMVYAGRWDVGFSKPPRSQA